MSEDRALVDVIVVNYHSSHAMQANLGAVMDFVGPTARLLVVNNSPSENLGWVAETVSQRTLVVDAGRNLGFASAVNLALSRLEGDLVLLVNPDARVVSGSWKVVLDCFAQLPDLACVGARLLDSDGSPSGSCRSVPTPLDAVMENVGLSEHRRRVVRRSFGALAGEAPSEVDAVCGAFAVLRRAALDDVGFFDPRFFMYYEETDWMTRARARGWKVLTEPSVTVIHTAGSSTPADPLSLQLLLLRSQQLFIRKHYGRPSEVLVRCFLLATELARAAKHLARRGGGRATREALHRSALHAAGSCVEHSVTRRLGA